MPMGKGMRGCIKMDCGMDKGFFITRMGRSMRDSGSTDARKEKVLLA